MKFSSGIWVAALVLALCFQGHAVLDELIPLGRGHEPPAIRLTAGEVTPIDVREGEALQSRCSVDPPDEEEYFTFRWVRRGHEGTETAIATGPELLLTNVEPGLLLDPIFCVVERRADRGLFDRQLLVKWPVHYSTVIDPISPRLEFNQPYDVRCQVSPTPREPVEFTWHFRDRVVGNGEYLHINRFDRFASGVYLCATKSPAHQNETASQYSNVSIELHLKPSMEHHTEMKKIPGSASLISYLGDHRELHCEIHQSNHSGVRWYQNGTLVDRPSPANRTGQLRRLDYACLSIMSITSVEDFHEGTWECRADTDTKAVELVVLMVLYSTEIEHVSPRLEFNRPYDVRCQVNPIPIEPVEFTWYFRDRVVGHGERLRITRFDRFASGEYICVVRAFIHSNETAHQYDNATIELRLKASTENHTETRKPPGNALITNLGDRRELQCEIPQNDHSGVRWYLNGTHIERLTPASRTSQLQRVDDPRVSILTISNVEYYHEGTWECCTDTETKTVEIVVV